MIFPAQTPRPYRLGILVFLALVSAGCAQSPECKRQSDNKEESPTFICSANFTFIRNPDCSATITERFLFPHTSGAGGWRAIPALEGQQRVSSITLLRDGQELPLVQESGNDDEVRVQMKTENNSNPVLFELSYKLSNAVNRFTQTCESGADSDESKNVLRWRSGVWEQVFDELSVTFQTENVDAKLAVLGDNSAISGLTDQKLTVRRTNVDDNVELYVSESGVELCPEDLICFPTGFNEIPLIIALCVIALLIIGIIVWCVIRTRANHKKIALENENDIEDVEAESP